MELQTQFYCAKDVEEGMLISDLIVSFTLSKNYLVLQEFHNFQRLLTQSRSQNHGFIPIYLTSKHLDC